MRGPVYKGGSETTKMLDIFLIEGCRRASPLHVVLTLVLECRRKTEQTSKQSSLPPVPCLEFCPDFPRWWSVT